MNLHAPDVGLDGRCVKCGLPADDRSYHPEPIITPKVRPIREDAEASIPMPKAVARNTDPDTSWDAADSVDPDKAETQRARVLRLLRDIGPMTDEQIRANYTVRYGTSSDSGLRTRRNELVTAELVRNTGKKRPGKSGRDFYVWAAVAR